MGEESTPSFLFGRQYMSTKKLNPPSPAEPVNAPSCEEEPEQPKIEPQVKLGSVEEQLRSRDEQHVARPTAFWYQKIWVGVSAAFVGFVAFGSVFGAIRNAVFFITALTTTIGTALIVLIGLSAQLYLAKHPLAWVSKGREYRIKRLGIHPILVLGGMLALLWIPRFIPARTDSFRQLALVSARKNLAIIHLRIEALREPVKLIGTPTSAERFRSLPDRLSGMGNLDLSFCRSVESHITDLQSDFLTAATAYCGTVSDFAGVESQIWTYYKQDKKVQYLFNVSTEPEAQLALACSLDVPERKFYVMQFSMVLYSATKMGLAERELLTGSKELGVPDLQVPTPDIVDFVRRHFHVDCTTGQILR